MSKAKNSSGILCTDGELEERESPLNPYRIAFAHAQTGVCQVVHGMHDNNLTMNTIIITISTTYRKGAINIHLDNPSGEIR